MKSEPPKRIAIIGLPGSGKSTLAKQLGKLLKIPVFHLDKYVFEDEKKRDHQELITLQQDMVNQESWIIEGCSIKTLDIRFARADTVIYLQLPRLLCLWRVFKRSLSFNESLAETGCAKIVDWTLLKYIWNFTKNKHAEIEKALSRYPNLELHVLTSMPQIGCFFKYQDP